MYYVYIIESSSRWYYGFSENLDQRIKDHNSNRSKYTRNKGPWKLIFKRTFVDKKTAIKFESQLKKVRNKKYIKEKYKDFFIEV